jgi:hypothetical protein
VSDQPNVETLLAIALADAKALRLQLSDVLRSQASYHDTMSLIMGNFLTQAMPDAHKEVLKGLIGQLTRLDALAVNADTLASRLAFIDEYKRVRDISLPRAGTA